MVSAPAGYGKSTAIGCWLESRDEPGAWLSLDKDDNDIRTFLTYFIAALRTLFPDACQKTRAMLKALVLPPAKTLSSSVLNELDQIESAYILVLDDYYLIKEAAIHDFMSVLLSTPPINMHLVIIGRHDPPLPLARLRAQGHMAEIRTMDLRFTMAEIETYMTQVLGIPADATTVAALEKKTEGWVTGLHLAALSMRHQGKLDPRLLAPQVNAQYVMEYLFTEVFSLQPPEISRYLTAIAILDRFCGPLCEALCWSGEDTFTCEIGGWAFIAWLKNENMFLISLDAEKKWFRFHHLFQKLLLNQLERRRSAEDIQGLHARASEWFAANDLVEEAITHALAAGDHAGAGRLVARFSHQLMNDQQWVRLEKCMSMLSREQLDQDPALLALEAFLQHIRHNWIAVKALIEKIEALNAGAPDTPSNIEYVPGLIEAVKGALAYIRSEGESALDWFDKALKNIPIQNKRAILLAHTGQVLSYQMIGEGQTGVSLYQEAMARHINRDPNYHAMYLAKLGLFHWIDADLTSLKQVADSIKAVIAADPTSRISPYYRHYFLGIAHYHRNELQAAAENLAQVVDAHYTASPINFAHSALALALTHQGQGKPDRASEISQAVLADSIETNNIDMLQTARAFEAELAIRQGRTAEAFQWAEKFQPKPFRPIFRFYMPQLTLVKVLLAQDTPLSRKRAETLLDQLFDFLTRIHNARFLIDVLAFQALLHSAQDRETAAIKSLTKAINLAEPQGFIRLFVDLGPRMADLLARLVDQNTAVDYVEEILIAFRGDATAPDRQSAKRPFAHSLIDPLTTRELDILVLLSERLRNKEIADRLFISPDTVKKHLYNIYQKIGVTKRRQAVAKAEALGIIAKK